MTEARAGRNGDSIVSESPDPRKRARQWAILILGAKVIFDLHIPFDVLVGASESCLGGYAPGWADVTLEKQIPGKVVFRVRQAELGDLGKVEIVKTDAEHSQVYFDASTVLKDEEGIAYALTHKRLEFSDEWAQIFQLYLDQSEAQGEQASKRFDLFPDLRGDEWRAQIREFLAQKSRAVKFLADARKEHWGQIIQVYFERLGGYAIWLNRPAWLPNARLVAGKKTEWQEIRKGTPAQIVDAIQIYKRQLTGNYSTAFTQVDPHATKYFVRIGARDAQEDDEFLNLIVESIPGEKSIIFFRAIEARVAVFQSVWREVAAMLDERGFTQVLPQKSEAQAETPSKPSKDAPLEKWFEYYHACKTARVRYTLDDLANETNRTAGYIRQRHAEYKAEHGG